MRRLRELFERVPSTPTAEDIFEVLLDNQDLSLDDIAEAICLHFDQETWLITDEVLRSGLTQLINSGRVKFKLDTRKNLYVFRRR